MTIFDENFERDNNDSIKYIMLVRAEKRQNICTLQEIQYIPNAVFTALFPGKNSARKQPTREYEFIQN